jgi:invasion protein IalB
VHGATVACDALDIFPLAAFQGWIVTGAAASIGKSAVCIVEGRGGEVAQAGDAVLSRRLRFERIRRDSGQSGMGKMGKSGHSAQSPHFLQSLYDAPALASRPMKFVLSLVLAWTVIFATSQVALAQGTVRSVHNDWQIRCDTPPGAQAEQCALIQSVTADDRPNIGLTVIVLKTADKKSRIMRVIAPPGVLLPSGLGLKIDNTELGRAGFVRCVPNGCVAEVVMDDNLLTKLRTGQSATFIIFQTPEEGIGFPISLKGLNEGLDKLP